MEHACGVGAGRCVAICRARCCCARAARCRRAALGPRYRRPDGRGAGQLGHRQRDAAAQQWPSTDWWRGFASADLNGLIGQAQQANDDLRAAIARVHQADAQRRIAGAPLLPTLDAQAERAARARSRCPAAASSPATISIRFCQCQLRARLLGQESRRLCGRRGRGARQPLTTAPPSSSPSWPASPPPTSRRSSCATGSPSPSANLANATKILQGPAARADRRHRHGAGCRAAGNGGRHGERHLPPLTAQLRQSVDALAILIGSTPESVDVSARQPR